jgi:type III pantothenate kinase
MLIDIGNTTVKVAVAADDGWRVVARVATTPVEKLTERLCTALAGQALKAPASGVCVACSVHPPADAAVHAACGRLLPGSRLQLLESDLPAPLVVLPQPRSDVGPDRIAQALGARTIAGAPCIVVSAGTAIVVDLVDADGALAGGAIAPGLGTSAAALHADAARLPFVPPAAPVRDIGLSTEEAIVSGVYWSAVGGIRALVARFRTVAPGAPVLCTGGDAPLLLPALADLAARHVPDLVFRGLGTLCHDLS